MTREPPPHGRSKSERGRSCGNPSVRPPPYHPRMRTAYVVFAGLMLLNVVYQFVTAGLVVFEGNDVDAHGMGANIAHLWALGMVVTAAVGKLGKGLIIAGVALFVLISAQYGIAESAGVLHPLVALIIAFGAYHALMTARALPDDRPAAAPTA